MKVVALEFLFGLWFCATVLKQFSATLLSRIVRNDFGLIPSWTFFAPNPGRSDVRLVYRDRSIKGVPTEWLESCQKPFRSRLRFVWNPEKFKEKALVDLALLLSRTVKVCGDQPEMAMLMWPFLVLLDKSLSEPRSAGNADRQFAILASEGAVAPRRIEA